MLLGHKAGYLIRQGVVLPPLFIMNVALDPSQILLVPMHA
eukprot:CAMPEP_0174376904 /NCGR_PEP_ID=MMETSP0811_2-20130205/120020_1 /TAXON_ID=73025 ORGANISM="Eutreptiella gymnastica-like, Strain CCMP1594" /NCGR_SAMPLE_ID=MMETSP0811_2 /ASSEMBLY_ACC=CAM_ASM_000667 /LENGTH=39 /DNA_ID= /DNA_START= /DNA_END= /DNA_ORIENTATION=